MEEFRQKVKESATYFKKNWIEFAKILHEVHNNKLYLKWGYKTIVEYAKKELRLKKETVFKLISSYSYLVSENLDKIDEEKLPSIDSIYSLNKIKDKIFNNNSDNENKEDTEEKRKLYEEIKQEVFEKDLSPSTIYKKYDNFSSNNENLEKAEIKKLKFHLKRAYSIMSKIELPSNINNSFLEIMEYIENLE